MYRWECKQLIQVGEFLWSRVTSAIVRRLVPGAETISGPGAASRGEYQAGARNQTRGQDPARGAGGNRGLGCREEGGAQEPCNSGARARGGGRNPGAGNRERKRALTPRARGVAGPSTWRREKPGDWEYRARGEGPMPRVGRLACPGTGRRAKPRSRGLGAKTGSGLGTGREVKIRHREPGE
ncbi:unnamed protein product [Linum trigynum]|uniref:Uncharacterized protein n=1 Tax=Linum trigynum TaxID=586398 RepID=A0AAV2CJD5_9ROSI